MNPKALIRPELIFTEVPGATGKAVLQELSSRIGEVSSLLDGDELFSRLLEREELCSTGIGFSVAVPHCKVPKLRESVLAVGISQRSVSFASLDGEPVGTFFVLASPEDKPALHLKVLSTISRWLKAEPDLGSRLRELEPEQIFEHLIRAEEGEVARI